MAFKEEKMANPNKNTDVPIVTFTSGDYERLAEIVGSLVIAQFDDQEAYRAVINELFGLYLENGVEG
jgi:hypothetical protein